MGLNRRRFIQVMASAAAAPICPALATKPGELLRWDGVALGASCSITIAGGRHRDGVAALDAAIAEIDRMESIFSLYRQTSEVMRLNRTGQLEGASPDMARLLALCNHVNRITAGRFDPTVQPLWRLIADTAGQADEPSIAAARALVGWAGVIVDDRSVRFARPGMAITLNGIAQGYATDRVAEVLRKAGCTSVLVDIGEIAAIGEREPGRAWRIGVAERSDGSPEAEVELTDMSIATSSPHGTVLDAAARIGHIIDPTSANAPQPWRRVSVLHPSAALADGLSTAFCLMDRRDIDPVGSAAGARVLLVQVER